MKNHAIVLNVICLFFLVQQLFTIKNIAQKRDVFGFKFSGKIFQQGV